MVDITAQITQPANIDVTVASPSAIIATITGGIQNFLALTDADPTTYSGQYGKVVSVNSSEDGLEFTINVSTNLSEGTNTETTVDVNSSDGTNATLLSASTLRAGLLNKAKFDEIVSNTSASHTQNTDTALGSGAIAADHGTAATDEIINVSYGTGDPPAANTTTEGSLFVKYTV